MNTQWRHLLTATLLVLVRGEVNNRDIRHLLTATLLVLVRGDVKQTIQQASTKMNETGGKLPAHSCRSSRVRSDSSWRPMCDKPEIMNESEREGRYMLTAALPVWWGARPRW